MTRTIQSPGFETREIDRSQYNHKIDNSLQNAPVCLVLGYADKGDDYIPQWINLRNTFFDKYGIPKSEKERYFYNAAMEIIDAGGICIASKMPYDNEQKQHYACTEFSSNVSDLPNGSNLASISAIDSTLTTLFNIKELKQQSDEKDFSAFNKSGSIESEKLEEYFSGMKKPDSGNMLIVDISHERYSASYADTVKTSVVSNYVKYSNDCLGIVPVLVSPVNAMYFQNILTTSDETSNEGMNPISSIVPCFNKKHMYGSTSDLSVVLSALSSAENYSIPFCVSSNIDDFSVSKNLVQQFPTLTWKTAEHLDKKHLKDVGIVVLKAFNDTANNNKISFQMLESFVGSIDYAASREDASIQFIDDVVNNNSQFIRLFSNFKKTDVERSQLVNVSTQQATSLGFYDVQCKKTLSYDSMTSDIKKALSKLNNTTTQQIDLVVDAGMTNIVQEIASLSANRQWKLENPADANAWQQAQTIFDDFCKNTRKDCMFIADGLRTLCLNGNNKIVNPMLDNNIEKQILPKFKLFKRPDSSYGAGYCNWFLVVDDLYSNIPFWMPPSAKVVRSYINCDTYYHTWDAPAGMTRGKMKNVIDVAFNPNQKEADYIYLNGWNYAVSYPLDGIVIEGQKTFQNEATAFDRVNVRRLMLWLERSVVSAAKHFLYESNTAYTRQRFVDTISPVFEQAKNGFGIEDYAIKCDDDLNTAETIDRNELHMKIAVKPVKTIEYIVISFVLTNQSASVQEEVLK